MKTINESDYRDWFDVDNQVEPFDGYKKFLCLVRVGSMDVKYMEVPILGRYQSWTRTIRFSQSDWTNVLKYKEFVPSDQSSTKDKKC